MKYLLLFLERGIFHFYGETVKISSCFVLVKPMSNTASLAKSIITPLLQGKNVKTTDHNILTLADQEIRNREVNTNKKNNNNEIKQYCPSSQKWIIGRCLFIPKVLKLTKKKC